MAIENSINNNNFKLFAIEIGTYGYIPRAPRLVSRNKVISRPDSRLKT